MAILHHRARSKSNASLISMVQRFSDITIILLGLYCICFIHQQYFGTKELLIGLIVLVIFQMIGGITDFYRSWRGVKISTELKLLLQNWTLGLIFTIGITSFYQVTILLLIFFAMVCSRKLDYCLLSYCN